MCNLNCKYCTVVQEEYDPDPLIKCEKTGEILGCLDDIKEIDCDSLKERK